MCEQGLCVLLYTADVNLSMIGGGSWADSYRDLLRSLGGRHGYSHIWFRNTPTTRAMHGEQAPCRRTGRRVWSTA